MIMKKLLGLVLLMLILISAIGITSSKPDTMSTPDMMHTIEGTWELQSFYNFDGQNIVDTLPTE